MALPSSPPERHRAVAGHFTDLVAGADAAGAWDAPAPVAGWTARDIVAHLTDWLPALLEGSGGIVLERGPSVALDPVATWRVHAGAVQALLDDPATAGRVLRNPNFGEMGLDQAIQNLYTTDVFMHSWDLARATGQDERFDDDFAEELLAGLGSVEEMLRGSGQYGPAFPAPPGADATTRLAAFIGRDPAWTAPPA